MSDYKIWFKSGNNISGIMDFRNSKELTRMFLYRVVGDGPTVLVDEDGDLIVDGWAIEALSISPNEPELPIIGFTAGGGLI